MGATKIFYVVPDNSPNISCPANHCATISQYFMDNSTQPVVTNVEYHLLPGEHYITTMTVLTNLQNFSLFGIIKKFKLPSITLVNTKFIILNSYNITITNVEFRKVFSSNHNLQLAACISCTIENVVLTRCGLLGYNLIGRSYLSSIVIRLAKSPYTEQDVDECYYNQGITLHNSDYSLFKENKSEKLDKKHITTPSTHTVMMQNISAYRDYSNCYTYNEGIINVIIEPFQTEDSIEITISNSKFYHMTQKMLHIKDNSNTANCMILIINCTFENIYFPDDRYNSVVEVEVPVFTMTLIFFKCEFRYNMCESLVSVTAYKTNFAAHGDAMCTNITFNKCSFGSNSGTVFSLNNYNKLKLNVSFIGLNVVLHKSWLSKYDKVILRIYNMVVYIHGLVNMSNILVSMYTSNIMHFHSCTLFITGPITISKNTAMNIVSLYWCSALFQGPITISDNYVDSIMFFEASDVTFDKKISFISNKSTKIISIESEYPYIEVMQHANITFTSNDYSLELITYESKIKYNNPYPFCVFQYITKGNSSTVKPEDYVIKLNNNVQGVKLHELAKRCMLEFVHFTSHCKWITTSVFLGHNPGLINQQIIQIEQVYKQINHHTFICFSNLKSDYDCGIDTLGPVYPGQGLQIKLFTPCSDSTSIVFAETHNELLPSTACKIAHQTELLYSINNYSRMITYTIVSDNTDMCELFLTVSPHLYYVYEAFYVQLLSCPVGFTLQDGICDCDPLLPSDIDTCYIEQSVIRRPDTMWITAHVRSNDTTKYLTGNCPMDYCLPYSSNVQLTNPDTQCQFNRTGILCSQCQPPLSMIFGSSKCVDCTNLHILITILIIIAGVILVTLIYLLNLTVTNGTISGIIFYANIISINDAVFLMNDNVYKPLRVFISFINLDLGIETCFYNGMDSYAKMWLQLFFPSYLIIIAFSIIITSRYSTKILRLTYTRSLPTLATLFLLSYNGILRFVLTVLFSYSTITHIPSGHQQIVWSIDASVPLFGLKFTILFIACLILLLLLIPFNIILLFTRYLSWFRLINRFKPLLDAFQGSYKDKYYYWVGVHIVLRSIFYALYAFQLNLRLLLAVIVLVLFACYFGYIQPYKNRAVNVQELLLLANLTILHAGYKYNIFPIIADVMISSAFIQFCTIVLYHFFVFTCHCNVVNILVMLKENLMKLCRLRRSENHVNEISLLNIPECTYNYREYRDGLISDDFK